MGEFIETIPIELLDPKRKREFLEWLVALPIDIWTKKYIYKAWCLELGVRMQATDIEYITGWLAKEPRG